MTCGLRQAGIKVVAGVDLDIHAKATYEINNKPSQFVLADIQQLPLNYFQKEYKIRPNNDRLVMVGCSPCQFYSIINTSKEKSQSSKNLLMDFCNFVEYYNPGYVLVENVPGILTNKASILPEFLEKLSGLGYDHIKQEVVDLSYHGVPQSRKRFSLIASRLGPVELPVPEKKPALLKEYIGVDNGFPKLKAGAKDKSEDNHTVAGLSDICLRRIKKTKKNGGNRLDWKDDPELQLPCFVNNDNSFKDTFGRMWWERPAPTITTKFYSVSNGRFAHPEENRALSIREGATLQTFPKKYIFKTNSMGVAARLIGNAVPCEYARRLGEILNQNYKTYGEI